MFLVNGEFGCCLGALEGVGELGFEGWLLGLIIRRMVLEYDLEHERGVRAVAFAWLGSRVSGEDGVVNRSVLLEGFRYQGARVTLISQEGIFKPRILGLPLSIATSPNSPYDDRMRDMVKE